MSQRRELAEVVEYRPELQVYLLIEAVKDID